MTTATPPRPPRVESVDLLRGIIIILMAIDHSRDFFGTIGADPTDLATTTPALFFTRWITHFCAPVFFLTTGIGAAFSGRRRTTAGLSRHLLARGLWLVLLEVTVLRFGMQFNLDYRTTILTVLWALGWSLVALALLVHLPARAIAAIGLTLIVGHNLLDGIPPGRFGALAPLWNVLHQPGLLFISGDRIVILAYPLIPWIGVTAVGYALARVYEWPSEERVRWLWRTGVLVTALFLVLRAVNVYGDPRPWESQPTMAGTLISFFNVNKYPPSLLFLTMTLGPALMALAWFDARTPKLLRPALTFGKVPLFFFLLHFPLIHLLAVGVSWARWGAIHWMFESPTPDRFPITPPPGWGFGLPVVYLVWAVTVVALYPVCRWYAGVKARSGSPWLSYL
ncbi:MAG TPA: heparan-alpha-glucosaminide N-acetyltransferase domain-containing protein [Gemmatimonadales bacterium]|nr:heparan-alpha-glucosaminide N-acetyltransferase domain-containing protein [Gemmatimonadales bacterium]